MHSYLLIRLIHGLIIALWHPHSATFTLMILEFPFTLLLISSLQSVHARLRCAGSTELGQNQEHSILSQPLLNICDFPMQLASLSVPHGAAPQGMQRSLETSDTFIPTTRTLNTCLFCVFGECRNSCGSEHLQVCETGYAIGARSTLCSNESHNRSYSDICGGYQQTGSQLSSGLQYRHPIQNTPDPA